MRLMPAPRGSCPYLRLSVAEEALRLDGLGHDRRNHVLPRAVARLYARENVRREDGQEALVVAPDGHDVPGLQEEFAQVPPRGLHRHRLDGGDATAGRVEGR